jgi:hypothetical protein
MMRRCTVDLVYNAVVVTKFTASLLLRRCEGDCDL